jgi:hypothetical protein
VLKQDIENLFLFNSISFGQLVNPLLKWDHTSWLSSQLLLGHKQIWRRDNMRDHWEVDYLYPHRNRGKEWWITLHAVLRYLFLGNVYTCTRSSHTTVTLITQLLNIECFQFVSLPMHMYAHSGQGTLSFMIIHENSRWCITVSPLGCFFFYLISGI